MQKEKVIYFITIIIGILFIYFAHQIASQNEIIPQATKYDVALDKAEVVSVNEKDGMVNFEFFLIDKKDEERHTATQQDIKVAKKVSVGDVIYVTKNTDNQSGDYIFYDYIRVNQMGYLIIAFLILVIIFGGLKGFNTVISLAFTLLALFYVFLPAVLSSKNVYLWGSICCVTIVIFTLIVVHGANKKSLASGIATLLGLLFAWIIMQISSDYFHFTGLTSEDAMYLKFNNFGLDIDVKAIFFTTIIIGALGAVMDVAMSISSSLYEFKQLKPEITTKELIKAGFEIGKDILGTMTNTLILAYVGSGFLTVLVIVAVNTDLIQIFNKEFLIAEIFEPLIGSFGIVATLPITSIVCAYLFNGLNFKEIKDKFKKRLINTK
ncbi:putative membrane protein [Bacilli bacterium PM5-3]|nr:putative membrane protein [Bacilli bacterium PM5-3]MDH6603983.1 putative membrane protein [Bacilli bacterium PM5-9]